MVSSTMTMFMWTLIVCLELCAERVNHMFRQHLAGRANDAGKAFECKRIPKPL
jgi:hypothetical protein